jgi:hypothetical protein
MTSEQARELVGVIVRAARRHAETRNPNASRSIAMTAPEISWVARYNGLPLSAVNVRPVMEAIKPMLEEAGLRVWEHEGIKNDGKKPKIAYWEVEYDVLEETTDVVAETQADAG